MEKIIIVEGIKEEAAKKLKERFPYDNNLIDSILNIDPTGYKYVDYIVRQIEKWIPELSGEKGGLNYLQGQTLYDVFEDIIPWFHNTSIRITPEFLKKARDKYLIAMDKDVENFEKILKSPKEILNYHPYFLQTLKNVIEENKTGKEKERDLKSQVEKLYEDDVVLVLKPKTYDASCYYGAATRWCTASKENKEHFKRYSKIGNLYYFINKKTGLKNALFVNFDKDVNIYNAKDEQISTEDLRENFPNQDNLIDELIGVSNLVKSLRQFSKGQMTERELIESDPSIRDIKTKEPLGSSIISIDFHDDEKFFKSLDLDENDTWFAKMIFSSYDSYEFIDYYTVQEDFKEGYIIYRELNKENEEKLLKISSIIIPEKKFDLSDEDFRKELSNKLNELFENEIDSILSDYTSEKNYGMSQSAKEYVDKEINDLLEELGFELKRKFDIISTTPGNLIMWATKLQINKTDVVSLFNQIVGNYGKSIGGWYENPYEFEAYDNFNKESFNREVERNLDKILEKIEEYFDKGENKLKDFIELMNRIKSKFKMNVLYELPKDKNISFTIKGFDRDDMKILVTLRKKLQQRNLKLSEDNFYKLLYQKELFDIFGKS